MNASNFPVIPRLESLHHRLKTAKDQDGEPLPLLDELMVFLEDPPPGIADRWQAGADLCAAHGIPTSRMSVWRFYRAHILSWRREHAPPLAQVPEETAQLLDQARHLIALRAVESLHQPNLPPRVLVGLVQNENRRQELQLARDKFNDQLETKHRLERRQHCRAIDQEARDRALFPLQLKSRRDFFTTLIKAASAERKARKTPPRPTSPLPVHKAP